MSGSRGRNPFSLDNRKAKAMQVPSETKPALWGAAGGAIALAIVGFTWGGWMTTGTANKLADQRADTAVVAILTPICVDKFQQNGDAIANLTALKKISSTWEQGNFVEKGGRLGHTPRSHFPGLHSR